MRYLATIALLPLLMAVPAAGENTEYEDTSAPSTYGDVLQPSAPLPVTGNILWDNGGILNSPLKCLSPPPGPNDESYIEPDACGTYGWGMQIGADNQVADDFTVPAGEVWEIKSVEFFGYQTGATSPSMIAVDYKIWLGTPGQPGSIIICTVSPALVATSWAEGSLPGSVILRTTAWTDCATNRIYQHMLCAPPEGACAKLPEGTYWIDWQADGTQTSGPWVPPVVNGDPATDNALQSTDGKVTYNPVIDSACGLPKDFPFIIRGNIQTTPVEETTWGRIKASMN